MKSKKSYVPVSSTTLCTCNRRTGSRFKTLSLGRMIEHLTPINNSIAKDRIYIYVNIKLRTLIRLQTNKNVTSN